MASIHRQERYQPEPHGGEPAGGRASEYLLPKTVVGLALWLLIFALGAGVSGIVFFVIYEQRLTDLQNQITSTRTQLEQQLNNAVTQLQDADKALAGGGVTGTSTPAGQANRLLAHVGPSLAVVEGLDANGAVTSGSGFVLNSDQYDSWILTSYQLVAGEVADAQSAPPSAGGTATAPSAPTVSVNIGSANHTGTIYSWDATNNIALIIVSVGNIPALAFSDAVPATGLAVWAVSPSTGPYGATAAKGRLTDAGPIVLVSDAVTGPRAVGGPLVDQEGKVLGILGGNGALGTSTAPGSAARVRLACIKVVICPK